MAIEIGIFHNGASDLKAVTTPNGVVVNDGSLEEVHRSYQRVLIGQVRQGILADRLGYDYWFMTEHHFMPEGPEFSPSAGINPCWRRAEIRSWTSVRSRVVPCNVARQSTRLSAASTASSVTSTFSPATKKCPVTKSATRNSRAAFCKSMSGPAYLLVAAKGRIDSEG